MNDQKDPQQRNNYRPMIPTDPERYISGGCAIIIIICDSDDATQSQTKTQTKI